MPVVAEIVSQPTEQDLIDLKKTYEGQLDWLDNSLAGSDLVIAGRFNDRLVAGFVLRDLGDRWQLEKLQVREITRRRGVARQAINSALKTLNISRPVSVDLGEHSELIPLFTGLGFTQQDNHTFQWQP